MSNDTAKALLKKWRDRQRDFAELERLFLERGDRNYSRHYQQMADQWTKAVNELDAALGRIS